MAASNYNHTAWWLGGFAVVLLIAVVFYLVYSRTQPESTGTVVAPDAVVSELDRNKGVGSPAPTAATSSADLAAVEASLNDSDLDAVTAELNQNEIDLSNF